MTILKRAIGALMALIGGLLVVAIGIFCIALANSGNPDPVPPLVVTVFAFFFAASLGRPRDLEKAVEKARSVTKPKPRGKAQSGSKKGVEAELARERRRVQQPSQKAHPVGGAAKGSDRDLTVHDETKNAMRLCRVSPDKPTGNLRA